LLAFKHIQHEVKAMGDEHMDKLVTIVEAAQQLSVSIAAVRGWRLSRKHLDFVKVGRAVRVPQKSIDKLIERQMVPHNLQSAERETQDCLRQKAPPHQSVPSTRKPPST
jgi:excisionase family DNA binding protein